MGGVVVQAEIRVGDGFQQAIERVNALEAGLKPILDCDLNALVFGSGSTIGRKILGMTCLSMAIRLMPCAAAR